MYMKQNCIFLELTWYKTAMAGRLSRMIRKMMKNFILYVIIYTHPYSTKHYFEIIRFCEWFLNVIEWNIFYLSTLSIYSLYEARASWLGNDNEHWFLYFIEGIYFKWNKKGKILMYYRFYFCEIIDMNVRHAKIFYFH